MRNNKDTPPKDRFKPRSYKLLGFILLVICAMIVTYNVPKKISEEDITYIKKIIQDQRLDIRSLRKVKAKTFAEELFAITSVQESAFATAPKVRLIPLSTPREPKNLYNSKAAYCGDRARYIDKALRYLGYTTRYASLYHNDEKRGFVSTLLTRTSYESSESHALIEVKTSKGWMIVDTRHKWISLTQANQPISLEELKDKELAYFQWNNRNKEEAWPLLDKNYYIIYELYSRHGQFYAPYTRYIPDINWFGFMRHNILKF